MKVKSLMAAFFMIFILHTQATIAAPPRSIPTKEEVSKMTEEQKAARINSIKLRVEEIKNMDRSSMSSSEKKALRKELRQMKQEARATNGVYLSVGAIIIIILLLILIL